MERIGQRPNEATRDGVTRERSGLGLAVIGLSDCSLDRTVMTLAIKRRGPSVAQSRRRARLSEDPNQARCILAMALVLERVPREAVARAAGAWHQTLNGLGRPLQRGRSRRPQGPLEAKPAAQIG